MSGPKPKDAARMTAPAAGVTVRLYRQGPGGCFLLAFPCGGGRPCYVLIDCGVLLGTEDAAEKMKKVAASLREATGGRIDVLVATLQHWDHASGFQQAKEIFGRIQIGQVWTAWTEDPDDPAAQRLRARRETSVRVARADMPGRGDSTCYWRPGDRPELPGVEGARVYVLGPPVSEGLPPPGASPTPGEEELKTPPSLPFDQSFRVSLEAARQDPFFQASYFGAAGRPSEKELAWRRIEAEWLTPASHRPLQLDGNTNGTGLALAIELAPSGKVLVFAADPQDDDRLSWLKLHWPREGESGDPDFPPTPITAAELLHRTVFYSFETRCAAAQDCIELTITG